MFVLLLFKRKNISYTVYIEGSDTMAKYLYGQLIADGKIVHIEEIPDDRKCRGAWACICPQCGSSLTARKGTEREPHFSHKPISYGSGCNSFRCSAEVANETALHKMAKSIIKKEHQIALPAKEIFLHDLGLNLPRHVISRLPKSYEISPATILHYSEALLEKRTENFQPDVTLCAQDSTCFIEITVAHKTATSKIEKIKNLGTVPVLEIDLHAFSKTAISETELAKIICEEFGFRKWIFFPDIEIWIDKARHFFESHPITIAYRNHLAAQKELQSQAQHEKTTWHTLQQRRKESILDRTEDRVKREQEDRAKREQKIKEARDSHLRGPSKKLLQKSINFIINNQEFSLDALQQHLQIQQSNVRFIIDRLEEMGMCSNFNIMQPFCRRVLISAEEWALLQEIYFPF